MKVSVAAFAPPTPPDTGASSDGQPRSAASAWARRALSTSMVEQSMTSVPGRVAGRMSLQTAVTCLPAGSMVITASASATASRAEKVYSTPRVLSRVAEAGTRSKPTTRCPALTRFAAIGPPMLPRPMKAMVVMDLPASLVAERHAGHSGGCRSNALSLRPDQARATITRMISFVPSRIWCTRKSRTIFSIPYSAR